MALLQMMKPEVVHENLLAIYYLHPKGVTVRVSKSQSKMFCQECCSVKCLHIMDMENWLKEDKNASTL